MEYGSYTVKELKDILRLRKLKVGGNKQELVDRLIAHDLSADINGNINIENTNTNVLSDIANTVNTNISNNNVAFSDNNELTINVSLKNINYNFIIPQQCTFIDLKKKIAETLFVPIISQWIEIVGYCGDEIVLIGCGETHHNVISRAFDCENVLEFGSSNLICHVINR